MEGATPEFLRQQQPAFVQLYEIAPGSCSPLGDEPIPQRPPIAAMKSCCFACSRRCVRLVPRRDYAPIERINVRCRRSLFPTNRIDASRGCSRVSRRQAAGSAAAGSKDGAASREGKRLFPAVQQDKRKGPFSHSGI
jgi:hypothetical protein